MDRNEIERGIIHERAQGVPEGPMSAPSDQAGGSEAAGATAIGNTGSVGTTAGPGSVGGHTGHMGDVEGTAGEASNIGPSS
jgi:hypothetical protein